MKKILWPLLLFLTFSTNTVLASFIGEFSTCEWITKGSLSQGGYYYLCNNNFEQGGASVWASQEQCKTNVITTPYDYTQYFCKAGTWQFNQANYPPCSCIAE